MNESRIKALDDGVADSGTITTSQMKCFFCEKEFSETYLERFERNLNASKNSIRIPDEISSSDEFIDWVRSL